MTRTLPETPIRLYGYALSGHAHRVHLYLNLLGLPYEVVEVDLKAREHKSPSFLKLNPFGQVPVIDDHGTVVWDSLAIMLYLSRLYDDGHYMPKEPRLEAEIMAWLSRCSGPIAYGLAAARRVNLFGAQLDLGQAQTIAIHCLNEMNAHLMKRDWLVGDRVTIADLSAYAYVARGFEGGIDVAAFSRVMAWLSRIEAIEGFVGMPKSAVGLWASARLAHR